MIVPEFARHWASRHSSDAQSLVQLAGGINNQVFVCGEKDRRWVIKCYLPVKIGERDRMLAEIEFLRYAMRVAEMFVPKLIEADSATRCIVLEYLEGEKYETNAPPSEEDIKAAINFFSLLNADRVAAMQQVQTDAAEGFIKLSSHVENVRTRATTLSSDHLPLRNKVKADGLINQLRSAIDRVTNQTERLVSAGFINDSISNEERCLSPSDFGFHNAIRKHQQVKFFDFEFAGLDDPAKAAIDFVLQPDFPVNCCFTALFAAFSPKEVLRIKKRCSVLGPVLRLKWVCIIAAVLSPDRLARIVAARPLIDIERLIDERLVRATNYLAQEAPFGIH